MTAPIATVYLPGGVSRMVPTRPGRTVRFLGGQAKVFDERDMPAILRIDGAIVTPEESKLDWIPHWMVQCGENHPPRADVRLPLGFSISGNYPDYVLHRPDDPKKNKGGRPPKAQPPEPDEDETGINLVGWVPGVQDGATACP